MTVPVDETQAQPVEVTCPGCFHPREWDVAAACPICKYRAHSDRSGALLAVGTPLKRYVIGEKLGQGGFGITYRGFDVKLHMKVAIKEYYPSDFVGRSVDRKTVVLNAREHEELFDYGLKAFLKEARTLAQVKHPHLVRVLNYFEMHQTAYLVMDYLEGEDLATHLKRQPGGRLPWRQAVTLMLPVLDGLRKVHEAGFMHRDLKPGNFYWTPEGLVLLDFGAARQVSSDHSRSLLIYSSGYAPYEQCLQGNLRRQGPWTDVYGIAATLYFMLTAQRPPSGLDRQQNVRSKQPDPLQPARRFVPVLPPALDVVLGRALAVEPEQRLQSIVEFKQQLEAVLAEEEKREEEKGTGAKSQPLGGLKRPTKLNLRAAVIAGMVGMLAWGGWWIGFGRSSEPLRPESKPAAATSPVALTPPAVETSPPVVEAPSVAPLSVIEPTMVRIPSGCFQMSRDGDGEQYLQMDRSGLEMVQRVCVDAFEIGAYEVTQGQWRAMIGDNPSTFKRGDDYPVESVSWNDAQAYLEKLNRKSGKTYRLPTEAEWEYACRGGVVQTYCGDNDAGRVAWYGENSGNQIHPVGQKAANGYGLYDMSGNVWEWTCSAYDKNYGGVEQKCIHIDASGYFVVRGGSWSNIPAGVRSASRSRGGPTARNDNWGFRLARSL